MKLVYPFLTACLLAAAGAASAQVPTVYRVANDFRQCEIKSAAVGVDGSVFTVAAETNHTVVKHFSAAGEELWRAELPRGLGNRLSQSSLWAHEGGVDLLVLGENLSDSVAVYRLSPAGQLLGSVVLADVKAGSPTFEGLYADEKGYILARNSIDPAYLGVLTIYDRTGRVLKREETGRLSGGPASINRIGEDIVLIHPAHLYFTSLREDTKAFYLTPEDLNLQNVEFKAALPVPGGVQFFIQDPSNTDRTIRYVVRYYGQDYTVSSEDSNFPNQVYQVWPWGLDSMVNLTNTMSGFAFEIKDLKAVIGQVVPTGLTSINVRVANRRYLGPKVLFNYISEAVAGGTQSYVQSYVPPRKAFTVCPLVPNAGTLDLPIQQALQLTDGSVLATQLGRPTIIKVNIDGTKERYSQLDGTSESTDLSNLLSASASGRYVSVTVPFRDQNGSGIINVLTLKDGRLIAETKLVGKLMLARKLELWEGGGRAYYMSQSSLSETLYVLDSLGAIARQIAIPIESRGPRDAELLYIQNSSFAPNGDLAIIVVSIDFSSGAANLIFDVQIIREGKVINAFSRFVNEPRYIKYAQYLSDGRLAVSLARTSGIDRDSLIVVEQLASSFAAQHAYPFPQSAFSESFSVARDELLLMAAKADPLQVGKSSVGLLTFDYDRGVVTDSTFVEVALPQNDAYFGWRDGSVRPGLFAYPLRLSGNLRYNAIAMIGTKSSAVRERSESTDLFAVTNPFTEAIYFSTPVLPKGVTLADALGRVHALAPVTALADGRYVTRPLTSLPAGTYVLSVNGSSRILIHQ